MKGQDANAKQVCFTGKDGRIESGQPVVAAVIIEPEGEPKKLLRVTLPLGMQLVHGTRIIVDQNPPQQAPYVICFANGCMSDYEVSPEMLGNMKKGQNLIVQAINANGAPLTAGAAARRVRQGLLTARRPIRRCSRKAEEAAGRAAEGVPPRRPPEARKRGAAGQRPGGPEVTPPRGERQTKARRSMRAFFVGIGARPWRFSSFVMPAVVAGIRSWQSVMTEDVEGRS